MHATTYHAPAERASLDECRRQRAILVSRELIFDVLEGYAEPALLLNQHRQVVAANERARELAGIEDDAQALGQRPGELLDCQNRADGPGGCGTGRRCVTCGAVAAILDALENKAMAERDCLIGTESGRDGGALEFTLRAKSLVVDGERFLMLSLRDASAMHRRGILERVLQHDLRNAVGGIHGLAEIMVVEDDLKIIKDCARDIHQISSQMVDQLEGQRQLIDAERDDLAVDFAEINARDVVEAVAQRYRYHGVNTGQQITVSGPRGLRFVTDASLLSRVLGNLVKNAVEAALPGDEIRCRVQPVRQDRVIFSVHNPQAIPEAVQQQIFLRSFSTKSRIGRGLGTFGARLLVQRYLGGRLTFTSRPGDGTVFFVELPSRPRVTRSVEDAPS